MYILRKIKTQKVKEKLKISKKKNMKMKNIFIHTSLTNKIFSLQNSITNKNQLKIKHTESGKKKTLTKKSKNPKLEQRFKKTYLDKLLEIFNSKTQTLWLMKEDGLMGYE